MFSDKRLKEDIKKVGELFDGTPVYTFKYKKVDDVEDTAYYMGVMAQEVEEKYPEVIQEISSEHGDFKLVNYKKLGERISNGN